MSYKCISIEDAKSIIDQGEFSLVDIRDPASYSAGNIKGSLHITDSNVEAFLSNVDKTLPLIVVCYHGNSSQGAAAFFASHGCIDVYSMNGGFEEWRQRGLPFVS